MRSTHDYEQAVRYAREQARATGLDVAIRKCREYGRTVYNVAFACRNDSDYARAEIVKASEV